MGNRIEQGSDWSRMPPVDAKPEGDIIRLSLEEPL